MRMRKTRGESDFANEALGADRVRDIRPQHLERDVALVLGVVGEIHRRHPTGAESAADGVASCKSDGELGGCVQTTTGGGRRWEPTSAGGRPICRRRIS